ncbi:phosphotransferase [Tunicatimonas pelagia]|uniref:phosphotransferase n=1 Tax=Tunicatimonas pelagia TaxID=931531 RepID=UPI002666B458|nr:phosphotransferase [Tunicatimonas pelagia]WKN46043.1 phosphotransferase [Tunicatimonas pelagia]
MKEVPELAVEYSVASSLSLSSILTEIYDLPEKLKVEYLHQGFNDTYLVTTEVSKYILRVYRHNWKSLDDIHGEIDFLLLLKDAHIPVSYPIANINGNFVIELNCPEGTRYAVLFSYAVGESISSLNSKTARLFGEHLGRLHNVTEKREDKRLSKRYTHPEIFASTYKFLKSRLGNSSDILQKVAGLEQKLAEKIDMSNLGRLPKGICHGDPHYENVFLEKSSKKMTIFDFDFCGYGYLHYDLGSFFKYERSNKQNKAKFLEGYEQIRPLKVEEKRLIPYFEVLMRIFHLGARANNADGIKNPLWPKCEIEKTLENIIHQLSSIEK